MEKILNEKYLKAVQGQLTLNELIALLNQDVEYPGINYFDYDSLVSIITKYKNKEITKDYFQAWALVTSCALNSHRTRELSWFIDELVLGDNEFTQKEYDYIFAYLKDCAYRYKFLEKSFIKAQRRDQMLVAYYYTKAYSKDEYVYFVHIVDHKNKKYDLGMVRESAMNFANNNIHYSRIDYIDEDMGKKEKDKNITRFKHYIEDLNRIEEDYAYEDNLLNIVKAQ